VTGASRGIGAATAARLAAEGAAVAITARTHDRHATLHGSLHETAERMGGATIITADLADAEDRARIVPEAVEALGGPIDVLVNNAAAAIYQPLLDYPLKRRRLVFEINLHAPLDLAQAVLPSMIERREGWIVNLSSGSAVLRPGPPFDIGITGSTIGVYGSSKAALNRLTNALGMEMEPYGIRINTVEPLAAVMTEGADAIVGSSLKPEQIEPMDTMVDAVLALCDCPVSMTGRVYVSPAPADAETWVPRQDQLGGR
jgi:NAD(P)-dependent dehydrogenase (short-subunit alcohol dehydrogenase family)